MKKLCLARWLFLLIFIEIAVVPVVHSMYQETITADAQDDRHLLETSHSLHSEGLASPEKGIMFFSDSRYSKSEEAMGFRRDGNTIKFDTTSYALFARLKPPPFFFIVSF